jgi:hypothetical protein
MMKAVQDPPGGQGGGEKMSVNNWIDLLSGELATIPFIFCVFLHPAS